MGMLLWLVVCSLLAGTETMASSDSHYCYKTRARAVQVSYSTRRCCQWLLGVCVTHCTTTKYRTIYQHHSDKVCCAGWTNEHCNTPVCNPPCNHTEVCYDVNRCRCDPERHLTRCQPPAPLIKPDEGDQSQGAEKALTGAAIAGIVIAALVFLLLLSALAVMAISYRRTKHVIPPPIREKAHNIYGDVSRRWRKTGAPPDDTEKGGDNGLMRVSYAKEQDYSYFYDGKVSNVPMASWGLSTDTVEVTGSDVTGGTSGNFADIKLGTLRTPGESTTVVVKMNKATASEADKTLMVAKMNYLAQALPPHDLLVCLVGAVLPPIGPMILLDYCNAGPLLSWLRDADIMGGEVEEQLLAFAIQVATAVEFLHDKGVIHRRLGARNVLLHKDSQTKRLMAKVTGFGPLRGDGTGGSKGKGPIKWMAPEQLRVVGRKQPYSKKTDVWSYGVLVWEVFSIGGKPYSDYTQEDTIKAVLSGVLMDRPQHCPPFMYTEVMLPCWSSNPSERPGMNNLVAKLYQEYGNRGDVYGYGVKYSYNVYESPTE